MAWTPDPRAAISRPASAGPIMRARLKDAEFRPTALVRSSGPTISLTNDCRVGASNADPMPNTKASAKTCQVCATPVTASSAEQQRGDGEHGLGDLQQPALGEAVGDQAGVRREQQDGQELQTRW